MICKRTLSAMRSLTTLGGALLASVLFAPSKAVAVSTSAEPLYFLDLWEFFEDEGFDTLNKQANATYFITSLQGLVNRDEPVLFLDAAVNLMGVELNDRLLGKQRDKSDDASSIDLPWFNWIQSHGYLAGRELVHVTSFKQLLDLFHGKVQGIALWDMETPSSVNLAMTAAGADSLLPLSQDFDDGYLFDKIRDVGVAMPVKGDFTGFRAQADAQGITGKELVYLTMLERYIKPGKSSPFHFWFNLDAYAFNPPVASYGGNPHLGNRNILQHNGLYNGDYWIAKRGVFVDLYSLDHEAPNDDPEQTFGTDLRLWNDILEESYYQRDGKFGVMGGFAPWWVKYSDKVGNSMHPIHAEQSFVRLATSYNLWNDADAAFGLSNASFYQHLPLAPASEFVNAEVPERELQTDTVYACFVMLDYDGSAWLNQAMTSVFDQRGRGILPLNWAINPLLSDRVPHAFNFMLEQRTDQDFFRIGDDGAGYIDPYYLLGSNRTGRIKEDGFAQYREAGKRYLDRLNMDMMGFYISDQEFSEEVLAPIADLTPAGMGLNRTPILKSVEDVPVAYLPAYHHTQNKEFEAELDRLFKRASENLHRPEFNAYRLILFRPHLITDAVARLKKKYPNAKIEFLDMHSFMRLKEAGDQLPIVSPFMNEATLTALPGETAKGIEARQINDGAFEVTKEVWQLMPKEKGGRYFYFDVDDAFARVNELNNDLRINITFKSDAPATVGLQYNSMWPDGNFPKPYAAHTKRGKVTPKDGFKEVEFILERPYLIGSQNGRSDFRFIFGGKGAIKIKSVSISTK